MSKRPKEPPISREHARDLVTLIRYQRALAKMFRYLATIENKPVVDGLEVSRVIHRIIPRS